MLTTRRTAPTTTTNEDSGDDTTTIRTNIHICPSIVVISPYDDAKAANMEHAVSSMWPPAQMTNYRPALERCKRDCGLSTLRVVFCRAPQELVA
jgi:hypothetical protein